MLRTPRSRLWIPTTLSLLAFAGCAKREQTVWVDVRQATRYTTALRLTYPAIAAVSAETPAQALSMPAIAPPTRGRVQAEARREEALQLMRQQSEEILSALEDAYLRELTSKARAEGLRLTAEIAARIRFRADVVAEQISSLISVNAPERGRVIVRLALLAGWPDTGGLHFVPIAHTSVVEEQWKKEADDLRKRLFAMNTKLESELDALLTAERKLTDTERAQLARQIAESLKNAEAEAITRARRRISATGREKPPSLLLQSLPLKGEAARFASVPGTRAAVSPPPSPPNLPLPVDTVQARLNIWLRLRGYKLASGPARSVPDKTGEFIAWNNRP